MAISIGVSVAVNGVDEIVGQDQIFTVEVSGASGGTITVKFGSGEGTFAYDANAETVRSYCGATSAINGPLNTATVECTVSSSDPSVETDRYLLANNTVGGSAAVVVTQAGTTHVDEVNEVQKLTFGTRPASGTYSLTFKGSTTAALNYNASASDIESALEAISTISGDKVDVTGTLLGGFYVTFKGTLGGDLSDLLTGNGGALDVDRSYKHSVTIIG